VCVWASCLKAILDAQCGCMCGWCGCGCVPAAMDELQASALQQVGTSGRTRQRELVHGDVHRRVPHAPPLRSRLRRQQLCSRGLCAYVSVGLVGIASVCVDTGTTSTLWWEGGTV